MEDLPANAESDFLKITDLIDLDTLQKLQDSFAEATGVASIITDPAGKPITKPSKFCRLCNEIIRGSEKGLANCMKSDAALGKLNPDGPIMCPCLSGGLWDGGASICVGSLHIANWLVGQIRNEETPKEKLVAYADVIGVDKKLFAEAVDEVKVMPKAQFKSVCDALFIFANQLSDLAYKNMALRESEAKLKTTLDSIGDAVMSIDVHGCIIHMNPVAERLCGWTFSEAKGAEIESVMRLVDASSRETIGNPGLRAIAENAHFEMPSNALLLAKDGSCRMVADSASPIREMDGSASGAVIVFRDVSEQRLLEERVRQGQKMEAVGRLAGGIAHDFNNMLGGILGAAELLQRKTKGGDPSLERLVKIILDATGRAADLTRKLLDFSRKGPRDYATQDMRKVIEGALELLQRGLDKKIKIVREFKAENGFVDGDAAQLQNAILNLGLNARDAMPSGGTLTISTRNVELSSNTSSSISGEALSGPYFELSVADTGTGIPHELQSKLFEPFFTTKEVGKGTGLGLASIYGTVKDHNGAIHVYSEPGAGAVFKIYLPLSKGNPAAVEETVPRDKCSYKIGRILLVDDEPLVRTTCQMILEEHGNEIVCAGDGLEAVEIIKGDAAFDLIVMDVIMPNLNGREAYERIEELRPGIPFIFCSGFTRNENMEKLISRPNVVDFVTKPFSVASLNEALAKAIAMKSSAS